MSNSMMIDDYHGSMVLRAQCEELTSSVVPVEFRKRFENGMKGSLRGARVDRGRRTTYCGCSVKVLATERVSSGSLWRRDGDPLAEQGASKHTPRLVVVVGIGQREQVFNKVGVY
jgi:hypothetical protein